jgi:SAM-dependent methyltransferase
MAGVDEGLPGALSSGPGRYRRAREACRLGCHASRTFQREMHQHAETFPQAHELGTRAFPYRPTFDFRGDYIDAYHERLGRLELEDGLRIVLPHEQTGGPLPGWLQLADALKLYEMAHFSRGDILEIGSYQGLSAIIMATALRNAGGPYRVHTVDLEPWCTEMSLKHLVENGLGDLATASTEEGAAAVRRLASEGRKFGFSFVDHSHEYGPVAEVCRELHRVLLPGSFIFFHDYNDPRNQTGEYGVYGGIADGLSGDLFEFYGVYGCGALYRARD